MLKLIAYAVLIGGMAFTTANTPVNIGQHEAVLRLEFTDGICSGTAISKDHLLTASHCLVDGPLKSINGQPCEQDGQAIEDGEDHSIIRVTCSFSVWARMGNPNLTQGERLHFWGNPGGLHDIYRAGYVMGFEEGWALVDAVVFGGDSGAGLFNWRGQVVGVVSTRWAYAETFHGMGARPMAFSREQLKEVGL